MPFGRWRASPIVMHGDLPHMLTSDEQGARQFLSALTEQLKEEPQQEDILIIEREVEILSRLLIF
jgi:hypothetical protein